MEKLRNFVEEKLSDELKIILSSWRNDSLNDYLNIWEKAIIYKYSNDGFKELNLILRNSNGLIPKLGEFLKNSLDKLPNFADVVYRGVNLSENEIEKYLKLYKEKSIFTENTFISTTKSKNIAYQHGNSIFRIISKKGKDIEQLSKHQKEKEVLFCCNSNFKVLDLQKDI